MACKTEARKGNWKDFSQLMFLIRLVFNKNQIRLKDILNKQYSSNISSRKASFKTVPVCSKSLKSMGQVQWIPLAKIIGMCKSITKII